MAADAPERRGKGGPFVDPDPDFVVARPGPEHVVELSMHAMFRPHFVLHTRLFAPQTDNLDLGDWDATWAVMLAIQQRAHQPPMMIYNCGYEGGASQGHKHVQVFTEPKPGFVLFPEEALTLAEKKAKARSTIGEKDARQEVDVDTAIVQHPNVPFQHFIQRLAQPITPEYLLAVYQRLLACVRRAHEDHVERKQSEFTQDVSNGITNGISNANANANADADAGANVNGNGNSLAAANGHLTNGHKKTLSGTNGHHTPALDDMPASTVANNVIMTPEWMCMIPRRRGGKDGTGAGSLGMLGLLWLKNTKERAHWEELGMTEHLVWMGVPRYDLK